MCVIAVCVVCSLAGTAAGGGLAIAAVGTAQRGLAVSNNPVAIGGVTAGRTAARRADALFWKDTASKPV